MRRDAGQSDLSRWSSERVSFKLRFGRVEWNSKKATAAVMQYGYQRVEFFGGYEPRCGEGRSRPGQARVWQHTSVWVGRAEPET